MMTGSRLAAIRMPSAGNPVHSLTDPNGNLIDGLQPVRCVSDRAQGHPRVGGQGLGEAEVNLGQFDVQRELLSVAVGENQHDLSVRPGNLELAAQPGWLE